MNNKELDEAIVREAERLALERNLEAIRRSPVIGPGNLFDPYVAYQHYRELVRTNWQPKPPEPDHATLVTREVLAAWMTMLNAKELVLAGKYDGHSPFLAAKSIISRELGARVETPCAKCGFLTDKERAVVALLAAEHGLSETGIFRQALRLYQLNHVRLQNGETVTWSGDKQRQADFAGPLLDTRSSTEGPILQCPRAARLHGPLNYCPDCPEGDQCELPSLHPKTKTEPLPPEAVARLTPEYLAMTPLQKWETLVLNGLIGTNEPWIDDMRRTLSSNARSEALEQAAQIADKWRDENKAAATKARTSFSEGSRDMAEMLDGAAIECNAIAGEIRALKTEG